MITRAKVLRALCRFDAATSEEISDVCGCSRAQARNHLRKLIDAGCASTSGANYIWYSATERGREAAR